MQSSSWHSLYEAASESANSKTVHKAINELLADDDLRQQLASGLGAQAVSLCHSTEAAQRIQQILIAACVVEANDAHHNEETTPSSELISIGGVLAELMLMFHDCYETCREYFKQAFVDQVSHLVSKPNLENSTFSCHLVVGAFLRVAEYPDQFKGVHASISFTAALYAYEVASLVHDKEQITDQMYRRIIEMYTLAFSDYQIDKELFEKSSDLLQSIIGNSRFHSFVAPILVETLENITKTSTAIACLRSYMQFIELLDKCGMNSVLPHYFCDDGFLSIMIDTSMELVIEMNTEDVTIMVYELLCTIIRSCPEGGVIVAAGALVDALNVDGGVFKSSEECQQFVEHVTKCLHQVGLCIQDLMDQDARNKRAISNEDTIKTVYEITNIMKILKNTETFNLWEDILTLLDQYDDMDDESTAESTSSSNSRREEGLGNTSSGSSENDNGNISENDHEQISPESRNDNDKKEEEQEGTRPADSNTFNAFYMGTTDRSFPSFGNLSVCQTSHSEASSRHCYSEASSRYGDKFRTQHNVYDSDLINGAVEVSSASSISDQSSSDDEEDDVEDENDDVDNVDRERLTALIKAVSTRSFSIDEENEVEDDDEEEDVINIEQQRKQENEINLEEDSKIPAQKNNEDITNNVQISTTAIGTNQNIENSLEEKIKNKLEAEDNKSAPLDLDLKIKAKVGMHSVESNANEDKKPASFEPLHRDAASSIPNSSKSIEDRINTKLHSENQMHSVESHSNEDKKLAPLEIDEKVHRSVASSFPNSSKSIEDRINAKLHSENETFANFKKIDDTATSTLTVPNASRIIEDSINNKLKYENHQEVAKPYHNDDDQKHTTDDEITRRIDDKLNGSGTQMKLLKHESNEDMLKSTLNAFPKKSTADYSIENRIKSKLQVGASPFPSQNNENAESKIRKKISSHQSADESEASINKRAQREINQDIVPSSSTSSSEESPLTNTHRSKQQIILDERICSKLDAQQFTKNSRDNIGARNFHSEEESDNQSECDEDEQDERDENMPETEPLLELDVENQATSDANVRRKKKVVDTESASEEEDDKLIVAMAIEDEDDNLNEARNYDPNTKGKLSRSLIRWTLVAFIAAVIVTLTLVFLLSKTKLKENEEVPPTQSPTSNLQGEIANSIIEMFGVEQTYSDPTSSYGKAFAWITQDNYVFSKFQKLGGVSEVARDSANSTFDLQQRFVCALFYFELKGNGWESCSASFDYSDTTCDYKNREQVIEERSSWLSNVDECRWGGIICNNGKIIGLDLSK